MTQYQQFATGNASVQLFLLGIELRKQGYDLQIHSAAAPDRSGPLTGYTLRYKGYTVSGGHPTHELILESVLSTIDTIDTGNATSVIVPGRKTPVFTDKRTLTH